MTTVRQNERGLAPKGRVDNEELEMLRRQLYAGGAPDDADAGPVTNRRQGVPQHTPAGEQVLHRAVRDRVAVDSRLNAEEADWLQELLVIAFSTQKEAQRCPRGLPFAPSAG